MPRRGVEVEVDERWEQGEEGKGGGGDGRKVKWVKVERGKGEEEDWKR